MSEDIPGPGEPGYDPLMISYFGPVNDCFDASWALRRIELLGWASEQLKQHLYEPNKPQSKLHECIYALNMSMADLAYRITQDLDKRRVDI